MKFLQNEAGWSVEDTPPFLAFRALRRRAQEIYTESQILDLSQGEPGYGFAPSVRSRQFYSYIMMIDTVLNNNRTNQHFGSVEFMEEEEVLAMLKEIARDFYSPRVAEELIEDLGFFLEELQRISRNQGHEKSVFGIVYDLFKYSIISGGRYPNSWGEMIVRMAVAEERSEQLGYHVSFEDIMIVNGASHGVGMFFKGFGEEGVGYLQKGDTVLMTSPVYAPYTQIIEERGLKLITLSLNPETGELDRESLLKAQQYQDRIKAIILIDPNNPTGFCLSEDLQEALIDLAEKHNSIILSDEVYSQFFWEHKSIVLNPKARKRTLRIDALSKIERATGVRFGDLYVAPEAREYIAKEIIEPECPGFLELYTDARWFLFLAKSVGGQNIGVFQHISGAPGTSQALGLTHIILGSQERKEYVEQLNAKVKAFYEEMGIGHTGNTYYGIINLQGREGPETAQKPIEQVLTELALKGVIVMPGYKFFSEEDRKKQDCRRYIRVSLPNLSKENTIKAAKIIREHILA